MRAIRLFAILLLTAGCNPQKHEEGEARIFLAYRGGDLPVHSLNIQLKAIELFSETRGVSWIPVNKTLELALTRDEFLHAFTLPSGNYSQVRFYFSLADTTLTLYDQTRNTWVETVLLDASKKKIPEERSDFTFSLHLESPLHLSSFQPHFLMMDLHQSETLSLSFIEDEAAYPLFDPVVSLTSVDTLPIGGKLTHTNDAFWQLESSGVPLEFMPNNLRVGGNQTEVTNTEVPAKGQPIRMMAKKIAGQEKIQGDIHTLAGELLRGHIIKNAEGTWLFGHRLTTEAGALSTPAFLLDEDILATDPALLHGQAVERVETARGVSIMPSEMALHGVVIEKNTAYEFLPMMFNTLPAGVFLAEGQTVALVFEENIPGVTEGDLLTLTGRFSEESVFSVSGIQAFTRESPVRLTMNFHPYNEALLFHETFREGETSLFFVGEQEKTVSEIHLTSPPVKLPVTLEELILKANATLRLDITREANTDSRKYKRIAPFLEALETGLLDLKLFRLHAEGVLKGQKLTINHLAIRLQPKADLPPQLPVEEDILIDLAGIVGDTSAIRQNKVILGLATGGSALGTTAIISAIAIIHYRASGSSPDIPLRFDETVGATLPPENTDYTRIKAYIEGLKATYSQDQLDTNDDHAADLFVSNYEDRTEHEYRHLLSSLNTRNATHILHANKAIATNLYFADARASGIDDFYKNHRRAIQKIPDSLRGKNIIFFNHGKLLLDSDTGITLPVYFDARSGTYRPREKSPLNVSLPATHDHLNEAYKVRYHHNSEGDFITEIVLEGPGQDEPVRLFLYGRDNSRNPHRQAKFLIESTPKHQRMQRYFANDTEVQSTLIQNKRSPPSHQQHLLENPFAYRLDVAKTAKTAKTNPSENEGPFWHYLPDNHLQRLRNQRIGQEADRQLNKLYPDRKNPAELRILFQLENDEHVINPAVYDRFSRYPDHTLLIQMSIDGTYRLVNGFANIAKFSDPQYRDHVIFEPVGHGHRFHHGNRTPATLANNFKQFSATAPAYLAEQHRIHNRQQGGATAFSPLQPLNLTPRHLNMAGCSLGKRGRFFGESFTQKLLRALDGFYPNLTAEAFSVDTTTHITRKTEVPIEGETGKTHRFYVDGKQVRDVHYRQRGGFEEFRNQRTGEWQRVFRGPPY